ATAAAPAGTWPEREARDPVEVERMMLDINRMPESATDGQNILLEFVTTAEAEANDLSADFLCALAYATPSPKVQQAAKQALDRLERIGVRPVTPVILSLGREKFHAAYMTDPEHPWQQSVNVAWERAPNVIQTLVFLLDFGLPWGGALKDMFATAPMTPQQYRRKFVEQAGATMGERVYHVRLARAQAAIAAALEANRKNKIPLSKEFNEMRHLVERWVLQPPAAALEADTTVDELGDRPLAPDRSQKLPMLDLRGAHGRDAVMRLIGLQSAGAVDEDDEFEDDEIDDDDPGDDEFFNFADVVDGVCAAHADAVSDLPWTPCWEPDLVTDYLATLCPDPDRLDDLSVADDELMWIKDAWLSLEGFVFYLNDHAYEIRSLAGVRGFHVSEHIREEAWEWDEDNGRSRVEDLRDFFVYLAGSGAIPPDAPALEELAQMLARPDDVTLLDRPHPLGGETALWLPDSGEDEHDEPLTYNEWWLALALKKKFKRNWDKLRREAAKKPDASAKLALLDRLQARLAESPEYLDRLDEYLPPSAADYKHAEHWFEKEPVNEGRAWQS
ncbi:MAG: hypothetical protein AAB427_16300, partial [Chloroflexota bacterium]